jgi:hypothetical protein
MLLNFGEKAVAFDYNGLKLQSPTLDFFTVKARDSACFYVKTIEPTYDGNFCLWYLLDVMLCSMLCSFLTLKMMGKG